MKSTLTAIVLVGVLVASCRAQAPTITIDVHDATVAEVLSLLAAESETNIIADSSIKSDRITMRLVNVTLAQALRAVMESRGLVLRRVGPVSIVGAADSTSRRDGTRVYPLRYLRPSEVTAALKAVIPDAGIVADDAQNAVIIKASEDLQRQAAEVLSGMDVPSAQVLFEVRVADVRPVNDQSDIGIQLGGYDLSGQPMSGATTYTFARNSLAINARLNALISSGHAQILATPKLLTLNNHEADLLIGETYPVVYYDARLGGQQVQFVDIGVKLRLTPTIGSDGSVTAEMHPEYSAIEGFVGGYPVLTNRKVDSKLRVRNGETIVLGGLLRDIDAETMTRVPGLSSIPIIGKLFQDRQRTHQRDEVVFLITPHILSSGGALRP
ncbi:MAG TPA: secretin N-terminal domain-containing protein [Candidatus Rubrimentiphilum sp.]|nr:secretin N-terminal domain-containing protein [Candidatus Rubrimentiphilum sp.]